MNIHASLQKPVGRLCESATGRALRSFANPPLRRSGLQQEINLKRIIICSLLSSFILHPSSLSFAASTINVNTNQQSSYGANIGWIVFTNNTATVPLLTSEIPRLDYKTGNFTGFAYGANVGWISLSNAFAHVQTDSITNAPDSDGDTIADAWETFYAGNLTTLGAVGHDQDGDGTSDRDEYQADTSPIDQSDYLRITAYSANSAGSTSVVRWTSELTRCYGLDTRTNLVSGVWSNTLLDAGTGVVGPDPSSTTTRTNDQPAAAQRFYRVRAFKPLTP